MIFLKVAFHVFMVIITGGLWFIPLVIWWMIKKK